MSVHRQLHHSPPLLPILHSTFAMSNKDADRPSRQERDQTDASLQVERRRADAVVVDRGDVLEGESDDAVRVARERADQIMQGARDDADRAAATGTDASTGRERVRADALLERARSEADAAIDDERAERRRYLADFLTVERALTDRDLVLERAHADAALATRDEFLATVSHDLRGLLGGLSLSADLLVLHAPMSDGGDKIRKHAATTQRLVAQMNRLVNDLVDIASIDAGSLALELAQVEVSRIVRDTLDSFEPIAATKRITLGGDAAAAGQPLRARLDDGRILQVLANLVSNAIKFTPAEGRVSIRVRREGTEIRFAVSDTGIGIPENALLWVFDRARQVRKDRRGVGLGLHISKCIVEAHGGRMWAESELAIGSTFHFTLPGSVEG